MYWHQKLTLKFFFSDGSPKAENLQQKSQFSGNSRDMRAMGFIDFEDPEERAKEQEEKAREREIYVKERVNKLLFIWNRKESTEEFEKEKDPMVILELQKKLHNEMNEDFKVNIDNMTRYLSKKDSLLYKKQDPTALTTHLTRMQHTMESVALKDSIFSLNNFIDEGKNREILEKVESGIMEAFDEKQRKLILSLIPKVLELHRSSMSHAETMTGATKTGGTTTRAGRPVKKGKDTIESLRLDIVDLEADNGELERELDSLKNTLRELIEKNPHLKSQTGDLYDQVVSGEKIPDIGSRPGGRGSNRNIQGKSKGNAGGNQMMGADQFVIDN
jgi:FtsZ-binding cell division protein ZapB